MKKKNGVTLIECLIALVIIVIASLAALSFFSYGKGGIGKQGNRRAAYEVARMRLEQLMAANVSSVKPPDGNIRWVRYNCAVLPCTWVLTTIPPNPPETVSVEDLPNQQMVTQVQWIDDPTAGTGTATPDVLEFTVKVWFTHNFGANDNFNRVEMKSLRTPS